jgi:hypothetical protein
MDRLAVHNRQPCFQGTENAENSSPLRRSPENAPSDAPNAVADSRKSSASSSSTFSTLLDREYLATRDEWVDDGAAEIAAAAQAAPRRGADLRRLSLSQRSARPDDARARAQRRRSAAAEAPLRSLPATHPPIDTAGPARRLSAAATLDDAAGRPPSNRRRLSVPLEPEQAPQARQFVLHHHASAR